MRRIKEIFLIDKNNANTTVDFRKTEGVKISSPDYKLINAQTVPNTMRNTQYQNLNREYEGDSIPDQKFATFYDDNGNQRRIHTRTKSYSKHIVRKGQERSTKSDFYPYNQFLRRQDNNSTMSASFQKSPYNQFMK